MISEIAGLKDSDLAGSLAYSEGEEVLVFLPHQTAPLWRGRIIGFSQSGLAQVRLSGGALRLAEENPLEEDAVWDFSTEEWGRQIETGMEFLYKIPKPHSLEKGEQEPRLFSKFFTVGLAVAAVICVIVLVVMNLHIVR